MYDRSQAAEEFKYFRSGWQFEIVVGFVAEPNPDEYGRSSIDRNF